MSDSRIRSTETPTRVPMRVITGGGERSGSRPRADLVEVKPTRSRPQLVLPGISEVRPVLGIRPVLLSVGFDGLQFAAFAELFRSAKVRRVVDIRKHAAFGSRDFRPWLVSKLFEEQQVHYERMFDLGNPFIGMSGNRLLILQRYEEHVREHPELVRELGQKLEESRRLNSPLLLLGRRPEHEGSERAVLVEALVELKFKFDLALYQADGSMHVTDPIPHKRPQADDSMQVAAPTPRRRPQESRPRKSAPRSRSQGELFV